MTATDRTGPPSATPDAGADPPTGPVPTMVLPDEPAPPTVVVLDGELDASDSGWVAELEAAAGRPGRRVVVDMLNVSFIDSSVVRALVAAHRTSRREGWIRLVYTNHLVRRVIDICGVTEVLPQYTSVDAALRGHAAQRTPGAEPATGAGAAAPGSGDTRSTDPSGGHTDGRGGRHPSEPPHRGAPS